MFLVDMNFTDMGKVTPELTTQHRDYLANEYRLNNLIFGGRKEPRTGGILLSKHHNIEALTQILNEDPFVKSGAATYAITEFTPVMASDEFNHILS